MTEEFIILRAEQGIFVGASLGFGFWTHMDCVGQHSVATFESEDQARSFVASWSHDNDPDLYEFHAIDVAKPGEASVPELIRAGLRHHIGRELLNNHLQAAGISAF